VESNDETSGSIPTVAVQVAQLGHNLQNLLMIMGRCVDSIRGQLPAGSPIEDDLAELDRSIDRTFHVTQQLLAFGRPSSGGPVVDINQLVRNAEGMIERALKNSITPRYRLTATSPHVMVNPYELEWILLSVIIHFREAMAKGCSLTIETANDSRRTEDRSRAIVRLTLVQTGSEAPGKARDRTLPSPWDASDIPASRLRNIANLVGNLGGWLEVEYQAGRGMRVQVDLPVAYSSSEP
jgi:signal transduction histidine kinase